MRKCKNCGFENNDEDFICKKCNFLLIENIENQSDNTSNEDPVQIIFINNQNSNYEHNRNKYTYNNGYYEVELNEELFDQDDSLKNKSLKPKNLLLGVILTALLGGLGNIYAGLFKRGIFQLLICGILYYLVFYAFINSPYNYILQIVNMMWNLYILYDTYLCINAINKKEKIPLLLGILDI